MRDYDGIDDNWKDLWDDLQDVWGDLQEVVKHEIWRERKEAEDKNDLIREMTYMRKYIRNLHQQINEVFVAVKIDDREAAARELLDIMTEIHKIARL